RVVLKKFLGASVGAKPGDGVAVTSPHAGAVWCVAVELRRLIAAQTFRAAPASFVVTVIARRPLPPITVRCLFAPDAHSCHRSIGGCVCSTTRMLQRVVIGIRRFRTRK